jgi:hypothetical protein
VFQEAHAGHALFVVVLAFFFFGWRSRRGRRGRRHPFNFTTRLGGDLRFGSGRLSGHLASFVFGV